MKLSATLARISGLAMLMITFSSSGAGSYRLKSAPGAETELRAADAAFAKAAAAREVDRCVNFYTDDARVLQADQPLSEGRDAIRNSFRKSFSDANFSVSWKVEKLEVASSGDLAYSTGTAHFTFAGENNKKFQRTTRFATVWKKTPVGDWKIALDADVEAVPPKQILSGGNE
ncbi:MAG TPA: DUF4440 domain-containing protein [Candidatus Acidoferrales bacterium]|nr:DUF4440 domain-containing protein [Candidatus Acidoferrales bacterium]